MSALFQIGPVTTPDETLTVYVRSSDSGEAVQTALASSADEALLRLIGDEPREGFGCEPGLEAVAERLGLRIAELAPPILRVKAALASRFDHGRPFDALEGLEPVLELVEVTERLVKQAPFGPLRGKVFEVRVSGEGPARYFEALVREATTAPEVAFFFRPGEAAQARALEARGAIDEAARFDRYEFALLPEPEFATSVYRELTGAKVAPTVLHVRDGKLAPVSTVDLATVLAAIEALVELSAGRPGEGLSPLRPALVARARRPDAAPAPHVGRNDPCPCGSGKKFKQCHLGREAELSGEPEPELTLESLDANAAELERRLTQPPPPEAAGEARATFAATGAGTLLSTTLLAFARPLLVRIPPLTKARVEAALEPVIALWNAVSFEAQGREGEIARVREQLVPKRLPAATFDALLAWRQRHLPGDQRTVGRWEMQQLPGGVFGLGAETRLPPEVIEAAARFGITPPRS